MTNPADSSVQNLLPVQAYFDAQNNFVTFIGQNQPFTATIDPDQSGLHITNSTIDSSVIGGTTPAVGYFTSGYVSVAPTTATGIANKQYVDYFAAGLSWKQPVKAASLANIASLSGFQTVDAVALTNGDRVLVKDQSLSKDNGIYVVRSGAWEYAVGADDWAEYVGAIVFVEEGSQAYSAWYSLAQEGGTLGVTALDWANFSVSSTYSAGTGLTLSAGVFSITNTGVTNATYGSASKTVTLAINAQGQATSASQQDIAIAATQITSGTIDSARLSGSYSGITGLGTLGDLTVTNPIVGSITGNAATATTAGSATTATTATNIAGGASGSVPYQTASGTTSFLAAGSNGQVLTLASGVPSWATAATGTVTSVSGTGTVNGLTLTGTVTSSGSLTLGGTLDLSAPPAIGGTTPNSGAFTTVTASTSLTTPTVQATNSAGLALKNSAGTTQMSMGAGGGDNLAINVSTNINGTNAQVDISPTGTGHVHINPTGSGSIEMNPISAGVMNNMVIGGTTPLAGTFTTLRINSTLSLAGSTGTSGYVVTSNGASAPTWQALPATGITITDDTTTNATRYLAFTSATSGSITGQNVASTKLQFNPSTGVLTSTGFSGSGSSLTGIVTSNAAGTGISVSGSTGAVTITNSGVTSIVAGTGISISGGTGAVTVTNTASSLPGSQGQAFTSNGTFTIPSGITALKITVVGGGGGGNGGWGLSQDPDIGGGGGGGGGTAISYLTGLTPGGTLAVTIGAGGAAKASYGGSGAGNAGGNSTVASGTQSITTITGGGGAGALQTSSPRPGRGGAGGSATSGTINIPGGCGGDGSAWSNSVSIGGQGGSSLLSGSVAPPNTSGTGATGQVYGGGGAGGSTADDNTGGGAGAAGIVIFEW
jgi:hypothetical protein